MSMNMRRVMKNTRHQGNELLALYALASQADADGFYSPSAWNAADASVQQDGVPAMIRALGESGEIVVFGSGSAASFWITIAFSPGELQEIATRRLRMSPLKAAFFVLAVLDRQHSQKRRTL